MEETVCPDELRGERPLLIVRPARKRQPVGEIDSTVDVLDTLLDALGEKLRLRDHEGIVEQD